MSPVDEIRALLERSPGLKAQEIAGELGLDKAQVTTALHYSLANEVSQDNAYRWWLVRSASHQEAAAQPVGPRTFLRDLCRYYLACLSLESSTGISIPAADTGGYVPLRNLPFCPSGGLLSTDRTVKRQLQKVRRERGQLTLYVGYAVQVRAVRLRNEEETRLQPVLLYPIEEIPDPATGQLRPTSGVPLFNLEVLRALPAVDSGSVIDEAIQLSEELGLANLEDDLPPWDEVILRLQRCRPDWEWQEDLNPYALSEGAPLHELAPGIYNRALLFAGTRSPFTYGLEVELRKLAQMDQASLQPSALAGWLKAENLEAPLPEDQPILEIVPLNSEQRQAVLQGLSAPLTVVTGPPGTGKSQLVSSLLANMAWQGRSVLFASKNNHAVDVVESRVNELGPYPLLLRLGKEEHQLRIAQHLTSALAASASADDAVRYDWLARSHEEDRSRFLAVQEEIASVVALRNAADELEHASEPARSLFGQEGFSRMRTFDAEGARARLRVLDRALAATQPSGQPPVIRLVWESIKARRFERLAAAIQALSQDAVLLGMEAPARPLPEQPVETWREFRSRIAERLEWAVRAQSYWQALERLRSAKPLEELARELSRLAEASTRNSRELWQCWLCLWPGRWKPEQRKLLSEYVSLLEMIAGGDRYDEGAGKRVFRRYYSLFPGVARVLPCWAVTSLSARGRLPLEPGLFDLIVIDEASQCDIASALPLLFRARRAVIIGDPLQLKHVSTVAPQQDRMAVASHGLAEGRAAWAYTVNSLFDLARSLCRHEDIVNLREHHRSHRDIIGFSNRHFYRGGLRVATDHEALNSPQPESPAVRWVHLRGKVVRPAGGGALNGIEAERVVAEVRSLILGEGYAGAVGVVTPFRAQANRIRTLVHQDNELSRRLASLQFVVDTAHGFQGDERDVIFFSPVVSAGVGESTLRFLETHGNLFNVAITRARSELIVVGDRQAALDCGVGYLSAFAEYSRNLEACTDLSVDAAGLGPEYPPVPQPDLVSDWERVFYSAMHAAGLRPIPQHKEAPYTLDFALFQDGRKLDIEVDGENYHRNWDGELCRRDQIRSRRLFDSGWDVMRFWVYEIRDDLPGSVRRVLEWAAQPRR